MARFDLRLKRASTNAVRRASTGLKNELRAQITSAGMGQRLANTWRSAVYPKGGQPSANAAASVWSNAPHIVAAYDKSTVIRAKGGGRWLAIPTENVPPGGRNRRLTPSNWPPRLGKLRFVRLRNGHAMLVAEGIRASYDKFGFVRGYRAAAKSTVGRGYSNKAGLGLVSVPMFILIPQVSIAKRLDVEKAARKWGGKVAGFINQGLATADR